MPIDSPPCGHAYDAPAIVGCAYCFIRDIEFHRKRWAGLPVALPQQSRIPLPCIHLGEPTGQTRVKLNCAANPPVQIATRLCAVHGICTETDVARDTHCCQHCSDRSTRRPAVLRDYPVPTVRHLLYHVYPRAGSRWRRPVHRIREALSLFNGRKIVAIVHDGTTEHPVMVRDALAGTGCEFVEVPNDPNRREVATFLPLFERVADLVGPEHATMYGHAKGVTRPPQATSDRWTEVLEETCLDHWPLVAEQLLRHPVTGPFKKVGRGWPANESLSDWHYSGTWYWFRNDQLFTRPDWRRIDQFWGGIEPYPSLHFGPDEAGKLFHEGRVPTLDLYRRDVWQREIEPALRAWRAEQAARVQPPASRNLNLGCGPYRAEGWLNVDVIETDTIKPDLVASGLRLPFADGAFGRAYIGHMLEHVAWASVPLVLAELRRLVRPGGEVRIVGPDARRAILRSVNNPDKPAAESHIWEIIEDHRHHQPNEPDRNWDGARHQWTCYAERVVWAMERAGFAEVRELPLTAEEFDDWPVVDFTNSSQCAVAGRVP